MAITPVSLIPIIKDYAFNATPLTPVIAGDTTGEIPESIVTDVQTATSLYVLDNILSITCPNFHTGDKYVSVHTIAGKKVYSDSFTEMKHEVNLQYLLPGIYIVEIHYGAKVENKKILIT